MVPEKRTSIRAISFLQDPGIECMWGVSPIIYPSALRLSLYGENFTSVGIPGLSLPIASTTDNSIAYTVVLRSDWV